MNASERKVHVNVQPQAYDVRIAPRLLDDCGPAVRAVSKSTRVGVVADDNTAKLFLPRVTASLQAAGFEVVHATLASGEANKTLSALLPIFDTFLSAKFERTTPVIALGGGVTGDMTGFVAATLLRGVPFVQMPTTLLSMVDASVGGKTGVDHAVGKNLIGAFHQPAAVLIDPAVLQSLPPRELRSGLAECVKHMVIRDENGFANMEANLDDLLALKPQKLVDHIAANVKIKAKVVEADPFEKGERAHLNFGHTFGHAIETLSNYDYAHGEAISLGMCAAACAARELKMIDEKTRQRLVALLARVGLPTGGLTLDVDAVTDAMWFDKKVKNGRIRFVLPEKIGSVIVRDDLPRDVVRAAVASLR